MSRSYRKRSFVPYYAGKSSHVFKTLASRQERARAKHDLRNGRWELVKRECPNPASYTKWDWKCMHYVSPWSNEWCYCRSSGRYSYACTICKDWNGDYKAWLKANLRK